VAAVADPVDQLRELWTRYGRAFNLTASTDRLALDAHIAESEAAVDVALRGMRGAGMIAGSTHTWVDVGSGGGFPGLVVSVRWPGEVVLVEPRQRRAAFLELAVNSLGTRARVLRARLEDLPTLRAEVWSARAVFPPQEWANRLASREGVVGGVFHLARGQALPSGWKSVVAREVGEWSVVFAAQG
jgi:16S rRNA (guanine527-N7)-methyltransferase